LESERDHYDQALALLEKAEQWLADAGSAETEVRAKALRRELEQQYVAVSLSTCNEFRALEEANRLFRETSDMDGLLAGTVRLAENKELRDKLKPIPGVDRVVTDSREMSAILKLIAKVGDSSATILFMGETGTGKGLLSQVVHEISNRRDRAFVQVNCAALPEQLLESE